MRDQRQHPATAADGAPHWGYNCAEGAPFVWGKIAPAFALCADGRAQSPIDVITTGAVHKSLPALSPDYGPVDLEVVNNGHSVEARLQDRAPADGASLEVGERTYRLVQFHWHTPSEHWLDGEPSPMELHFVHADGDDLLVLGALVREGRANQELDKLWSVLPREPGERAELQGFDLAKLLPASLSSYRYAGSLTTPPCDEGIQWILLAEPIELSAEQIATFQELFLGTERFPAGNARPLQPRNGRQISTDAGERCAIDGSLGGAWREIDGDWTVRFFDRRFAVASEHRLDTVAPVVECSPGWAEDSSMGLLPIETLDGIDTIRATMGLEPLDDYLAHFDLDERRVLNCR